MKSRSTLNWKLGIKLGQFKTIDAILKPTPTVKVIQMLNLL